TTHEQARAAARRLKAGTESQQPGASRHVKLSSKFILAVGLLFVAGDCLTALIFTEDAGALPPHQIVKIFAVLGMMALLEVLLLMVLFEGMVRGRLRRLGHRMEQLSANPAAPARLHDPWRDEIGLMAGAFNRMADALNESHRSLELRVQERTVALALAK